MASSTILMDLEEKFFWCSFCNDRLKNPKLLPCLHRYCGDCLKTVIQVSNDGPIKCRLCKQDFSIPENGLDGFRSDFHMENMIEFIRLESVFEETDLKECVGCLKRTNVSGYCFKCRDFLCDQCYNIHVSSKMFADHLTHSPKLDKRDERSSKWKKLAALTEKPMCRNHLEEPVQLCCRTCDNEPICVICTYTYHRGHSLDGVRNVAKSEKEAIEPKIIELHDGKSHVCDISQKVERTKKELNENATKKTETLKIHYEREKYRIDNKLTERIAKRNEGLMEIDDGLKKRNSTLGQDMDYELSRLRAKYDCRRRAAKKEFDDESTEFQKACDEIEDDLNVKLVNLDQELEELAITTERLRIQNEDKLNKITENCEHIIERSENIISTNSSILTGNEDWTIVQCMPDVKTACEPLLEETKKEFPDLESLSNIVVDDITKVIVDDVIISDQPDYVFPVNAIKTEQWTITGMTSHAEGTIVITGMRISDEHSHITVISREGKKQQQHDTKKDKKYHRYPYRYCCSLSNVKIATVCGPDEVGIYDVRDGSYIQNHISDVIDSSIWPAGRIVTCVTTDPANNHIIVGTDSRDVYVFHVINDQLTYVRTITLPDEITELQDVTFYKGNLLVCDINGGRAYSVNVNEGSESRLVYELPKINQDFAGGLWRPLSLCADNNGFIYVLWRNGIQGNLRHTLAQYSPDGRKLLTTRVVHKDSRCVTTFRVDDSERPLISTFESGLIYRYILKMK